MAIPDLANGVLPEGVHDCTLTEAQNAFAHGNPNEKRVSLWRGLVAFLQAIEPIRHPDVFHSLYIDGSFTTDKEDPGDIDIVLEAAAPGSLAIRAIVQAGLMHILDEDQTHDVYGLHVFLAFPGDDCWIRFFRTLKPAEAQRRGMSPSETRGVLRVKI